MSISSLELLAGDPGGAPAPESRGRNATLGSPDFDGHAALAREHHHMLVAGCSGVAVADTDGTIIASTVTGPVTDERGSEASALEGPGAPFVDIAAIERVYRKLGHAVSRAEYWASRPDQLGEHAAIAALDACRTAALELRRLMPGLCGALPALLDIANQDLDQHHGTDRRLAVRRGACLGFADLQTAFCAECGTALVVEMDDSGILGADCDCAHFDGIVLSAALVRREEVER